MRAVRILALGAIAWAAVGGLRARAAAPGARDFYLSLLGESGLEVFSDERVFALYAAFNALGYDAGPLARQEPIGRPAFTALRAQVRAQAPMSAALQKRFQDFFDAHPLPRDSYVDYVMSLGPGFVAGGASEHGGLGGFEKLLAAHEAEAHVAQLYLALAPQLRELLKTTLAAAEPLCRETDKLLGASGPSALSLEINALDDASMSGLSTGGSAPFGVAGATEFHGKAGDVSSAVATYAALRALPKLGAHPLPAGVGELVARVKKRGLAAASSTPVHYVAEAFGAAVAAQVIPQRRQAILSDAADRGLWLAADFDRMLMEDRGKANVDEIFGPRLAALDFKKVAPTPAPGP